MLDSNASGYKSHVFYDYPGNNWIEYHKDSTLLTTAIRHKTHGSKSTNSATVWSQDYWKALIYNISTKWRYICSITYWLETPTKTRWKQMSPINTESCTSMSFARFERIMFYFSHGYLFCVNMMTSSNGIIFRVTGQFCWEFNGNRWIPRTKASDAELWYFLWSAPE